MTNKPMLSVEREHRLKIHRKPFLDLESGAKTCEIRDCSDRDFQIGDIVLLMLVDETGNPTANELRRKITHIQTGYGLPDDLCVLSYEPSAQHQGEPVKVAFSALAYGAKFKYDAEGMRDHAYVKIGHNEVADWNEKLVAASWVAQGVFSFTSDDSKLSEEVFLITSPGCMAEQPAPVAPQGDPVAQVVRTEWSEHAKTIVSAALSTGAEQASPVAVVMPNVDELAQIIRKVDGSHTLGAGSLAEAILGEVAKLNRVKP